MVKKTLIEYLKENKKPVYDWDMNAQGVVKIKNKLSLSTSLLRGSEAKDFSKELSIYNKKFGAKANFDQFMKMYGYDGLFESVTKENDYKYQGNNAKDLEEAMKNQKKNDSNKDADNMDEADEKFANAKNKMNKKSISEKMKKMSEKYSVTRRDDEEYEDEMDEMETDSKDKDEMEEEDGFVKDSYKKNKKTITEKKKKMYEDDDEGDDSESDEKDEDEGKLTNDDDKEEKDEEAEDKDEDDKKDVKEMKKMKESLDDILDEAVEGISLSVSDITDEDLSEEDVVQFKAMAKIMEDRLKSLTLEVGVNMIASMNESNEAFQEDLLEATERYLENSVKHWMAENQEMVEGATKATINEDVVTSILTILEDNNINIDSKAEARIENMSEENSNLNETITNLSEEILAQAEEVETLRKQMVRQKFVFESTDQADVFDNLVEDVDYTNDQDYENRLNLIKDKYITESAISQEEEDLTEDIQTILEDFGGFKIADETLFEALLDEDGEEDLTEGADPMHGRVQSLLEQIRPKKLL